jgi:hypothetical protein
MQEIRGVLRLNQDYGVVLVYYLRIGHADQTLAKDIGFLEG